MSTSNKAAANAPVPFTMILTGTINPHDVNDWVSSNGKRSDQFLKVEMNKEEAEFHLHVPDRDVITLEGKDAMQMLNSRARYNPLSMTLDKWNEITAKEVTADDLSKLKKDDLVELLMQQLKK